MFFFFFFFSFFLSFLHREFVTLKQNKTKYIIIINVKGSNNSVGNIESFLLLYCLTPLCLQVVGSVYGHRIVDFQFVFCFVCFLFLFL